MFHAKKGQAAEGVKPAVGWIVGIIILIVIILLAWGAYKLSVGLVS